MGQARGCSKCLNRKERTEGKGLARARCSTERRIKISMISPHDNIHPRPRRSSSWESPSAEPQPGGVGAGGEVPLAIRFWRVAPGPGARRSQHRDSWQRSRHERPASPAARPSLPRQSRRATRRLVNAFVYARHGRDLMGCKSPVCKPCYCRDDRSINTSRRQGRNREGPSEGSWSAKL